MKLILRVFAGLAVLALVVGLIYRTELTRLWRVSHLFDADRIVWNFQNMDQLFPSQAVEGGAPISEFPRGEYTLPASFVYSDGSDGSDGNDGNHTFETEAFLADAQTTGLLILHNGTILYERYFLGHAADKTHIAWSVSKSFLSALFGIAIEEGHIRGIEEPVTDYLPELKGSGYDGVRIKDVLQMSSGVGFNEDYGDPDSDINRMGEALALGQTLLDFAGTLNRVRPPGTMQHYVSIDTQVLGTLLVRATGKSLSEYSSEKLWKPMGMESEAYWMIDGANMEMAFGGLNVGLRDFARLGQLYLRRGNWNGNQIVPAAWIDASVTPDAPHLMPGEKPGGQRMGYGYQWWIPENSAGDYMALGVYNQMIYVDPSSQLVIARHAANLDFQRNDFEATRESVALWRTIARDLAP